LTDQQKSWETYIKHV